MIDAGLQKLLARPLDAVGRALAEPGRKGTRASSAEAVPEPLSLNIRWALNGGTLADSSVVVIARLPAILTKGRTRTTSRLPNREVVETLERFREETGALKDLSFDTIAGAGPNGALPHADPGEAVIQRGDLVVVMNLTPEPRFGYRVGVPCAGTWVELLDGDAATDLALAVLRRHLDAAFFQHAAGRASCDARHRRARVLRPDHADAPFPT